MYFNGNYGNYWQLDNDSNMQLSEKEVAIATRAYFATISFTDSEIGRVLDAARALGEKAWGEMVVVLWSDHGQNVGTAASTLFWAIFHAFLLQCCALPTPCAPACPTQRSAMAIMLVGCLPFRCHPPIPGAATQVNTGRGAR